MLQHQHQQPHVGYAAPYVPTKIPAVQLSPRSAAFVQQNNHILARRKGSASPPPPASSSSTDAAGHRIRAHSPGLGRWSESPPPPLMSNAERRRSSPPSATSKSASVAVSASSRRHPNTRSRSPAVARKRSPVPAASAAVAAGVSMNGGAGYRRHQHHHDEVNQPRGPKANGQQQQQQQRRHSRSRSPVKLPAQRSEKRNRSGAADRGRKAVRAAAKEQRHGAAVTKTATSSINSAKRPNVTVIVPLADDVVVATVTPAAVPVPLVASSGKMSDNTSAAERVQPRKTASEMDEDELLASTDDDDDAVAPSAGTKAKNCSADSGLSVPTPAVDDNGSNDDKTDDEDDDEHEDEIDLFASDDSESETEGRFKSATGKPRGGGGGAAAAPPTVSFSMLGSSAAVQARVADVALDDIGITSSSTSLPVGRYQQQRRGGGGDYRGGFDRSQRGRGGDQRPGYEDQQRNQQRNGANRQPQQQHHQRGGNNRTQVDTASQRRPAVRDSRPEVTTSGHGANGAGSSRSPHSRSTTKNGNSSSAVGEEQPRGRKRNSEERGRSSAAGKWRNAAEPGDAVLQSLNVSFSHRHGVAPEGESPQQQQP